MNAIRFFEAKLEEVSIDRQDLFSLMGYGEHMPNEEILEMIESIHRELIPICKPRYGYTVYDGKNLNREQIQLGDVVLSPGKIITSAMRYSSRYAIFTATIGEGFDHWLEDVKKEDDMVKMFVGNTFGSVLAEGVVSLLTSRLGKDMAEENLLITNNYSPGYCDWLLVEQRLLFSFFPNEISGIKLTDSCLMLPIKSVSGMIGIGENVKKRAYGCDICNMSSCIKNKKKRS